MLPILLCVDDEMILLKSLEYELEEFFNKQIEILIAQDPIEAMEIIQDTFNTQKKIFLVISDHQINEYDGIDFLKELNKFYPSIFKILLTGYKTPEIEQELKNNHGVYAVIEKPWLTAEIIQNVQECLNLFLER